MFYLNVKKVLLLAAIMVGFLNVAPYLAAYFFITPEVSVSQSEKLHFFYQDSELIYLGRIHEVMEGEWSISSMAFAEYKNEPVIQQPFGEWLYVVLSLGQTDLLFSVAILTKAIFPALLFLLLFFLLRFLLQKENIPRTPALIISGTLAWLVSSGLDVLRPHHLFNAFLTEGLAEPQFSLWTRIVNPITGMLGLVSVMFVLAKAEGETSLWRGVLLGLLIGFSSGYIFSFALICAYVGVIGVFWILYHEWNRVSEGVIAGFVALLCNYTFVLSLFSIIGGEAESLGKNGLFETTLPLINKMLLAGSLVWFVTLLYFIYFERQSLKALFLRPWWRFSAAGILASFVCYWQQVITGKTVWPQHFVQYTDPLVLIIVGVSSVLLFFSIIKYFPAWKPSFSNKLVAGCAFLVVGLIIIVQIATIPTVNVFAEKYADSQRYVPTLDWLNENTEVDSCVVLPLESELRFERYVFSYTDCDLYHSYYVYMSVPEERIYHNYVTYLRLFGVTHDTLEKYLDDNFYQWQHLFFTDWYEKFSKNADTWLQSIAKPNQKQDFYNNTKEKIEQAFLKSLDTDILDWLHVYEIDYIVVDGKYDQIILDEDMFIPLATSNQITIYKVVVQ